MAIKDNKILSWTNPIVNEADRPQRTASEMKAVFDSNSNQLRVALNGLIDDLARNGAAELPATPIAGVSGTTVEEQLTGLKTYADKRETAAKKYADDLAFKSGAADMTKAVYDPKGKAQDVFAYTDAAITNLSKETNLALAAKENKHTTTTATLLASAWVEDGETYSQTVTVIGMTADEATCHVWVSPSPDSYTAYGAAQCRATAQGAGTLTFVCGSVPETDLVVNLDIVVQEVSA